MEQKTTIQEKYKFAAAVGILAVILVAAQYVESPKVSKETSSPRAFGTELPVRWGNLGAKMASVGLVNAEKFRLLHAVQGSTPEEIERLLSGGSGNLKINKENSRAVLNLLWALGLGNKNAILEEGEMQDTRYGGPGNFASTGGWTLAHGSAMDHYSRHPLVLLTPEEQELVERVSKNIYRPCCNNSTHFPDCNHGMAMLGLLELLASQGASEDTMYRTALQVHSFWFPDTYATIATYLKSRGMDLNEMNPKEILGAEYSSASGYRRILSEVESPQNPGGGSCGT